MDCEKPDSISPEGLDINRREFVVKAAAMAGGLLIPQVTFNSPVRTNDARGRSVETKSSIATMAEVANVFLRSLKGEQRDKAIIVFDDEERSNWHFTPRARRGIPYKDLDPSQRLLATALLTSGLSQQGFIKAATIISLESVLRELEGGSPRRDAELYYVSLFSTPDTQKPWGWRVEGHHISLNFTIVGADLASTPAFLGANPAEVMHGTRKGLRALGKEEDLAREFLASLDDKQRHSAVVSESAPSDILTGNSRKAEPQKPPGITAATLSQKQAEILMGIVREYANNMSPDIAAARLERIRSAGFGGVGFAWAGSLERRSGHYYRIQGPTFLIEYDNTQNNANHIHAVWRDFDGDFGRDLLARHYKESHR